MVTFGGPWGLGLQHRNLGGRPVGLKQRRWYESIVCSNSWETSQSLSRLFSVPLLKAGNPRELREPVLWLNEAPYGVSVSFGWSEHKHTGMDSAVLSQCGGPYWFWELLRHLRVSCSWLVIPWISRDMNIFTDTHRRVESRRHDSRFVDGGDVWDVEVGCAVCPPADVGQQLGWGGMLVGLAFARLTGSWLGADWEHHLESEGSLASRCAHPPLTHRALHRAGGHVCIAGVWVLLADEAPLGTGEAETDARELRTSTSLRKARHKQKQCGVLPATMCTNWVSAGDGDVLIPPICQLWFLKCFSVQRD